FNSAQFAVIDGDDLCSETGDNQRPQRTMSGIAEISAWVFRPCENLNRGSRRNQLRRGHHLLK
ncbi:hypothetical protein, partial [[Clostridium] symbiosum]|uniref:hypothetical protein n=1 Tax=Clostridium symbiosum TaxID=1512 RepID=UPI001A994C4D